MPGQHSDEERERKERIKKLKAKTSKMRLAVVKKENNPTDIKESKPDSKSGKPCATCGKKSSDESYSCIHNWLGC